MTQEPQHAADAQHAATTASDADLPAPNPANWLHAGQTVTDPVTPADRDRPRQSVIQELTDIVDGSRFEKGGYHAEHVSQQAAATAIDFIRQLPDGVPIPTLCPEPDGGISLDWSPSRTRSLIVNIKESTHCTCKLPFAFFRHFESGHGVVTYGKQIPRVILSLIRDTFTP